MAVLMVILFIAFAILGKKLEGTWFNFLTFFTGMWALIVGLASMRLYDMNEISQKAYLIVLVGVVSFTIGYCLFNRYPFSLKINQSTLIKKTIYTPRETFFKLIIIINLFVWLLLAYQTFVELRSGITYDHIRDIYGGVSEDSTLFANKYFRVFVHSFFVPCVFVITAKILYSLFSKRYHWVYYALSLLIVALYCFTTGSRQILLDAIFEILLLFSLNKVKKKNIIISRKAKRRIYYLIIIGIIGIALITVLRPGSSSAIMWTTQMTIYAYITLPMPMLSHWINVVDMSGIRTHGYAFAKGGVNLLSRLKLPLPSSYYEASANIAAYSDTYVPMFGTKVFNAFDTVFFYYYLDFGWVGVILFSFLFGIICAGITYKAKKEHDEFHIILMLIFSIAVIKSFSRWEFIKEDYIVAFIIWRLLYKKSSYVTIPDTFDKERVKAE